MVAIEQGSFETDRISARQYRYLLRSNSADVRVAVEQGQLLGTAITLFRKRAAQARMYSIAVSASARGRGIGRALLESSEQAARNRGCAHIRSEIRTDNLASQALFRSFGYRQFGTAPDFYEDHTPALLFSKRLVHRSPDASPRVPYYRQTLDFTCGSASLLMAMKAIQPKIPMDRSMEIRVWREATTVFMTAGHGGCGPYGLALAAHRRGFATEVCLSRPTGLFVDSVRDKDKQEVIRLVEEDFRKEIQEAGIPVHFGARSPADLGQALADGFIPVVLISSYRMYEETFPHWIVMTGIEDDFVFLHDPYVDTERGKIVEDCMDLPVRRSEFDDMIRYGPAGRHAMVLVGPAGARRKRGA